MKTKIYGLVKELLTDNPETRNSDKRLQWKACEVLGRINFTSEFNYNYMTFEDFMEAPSFETIRRCRQMIQAKYPELRGSRKIQEARKSKEKDWAGMLREKVGDLKFSEEIGTRNRTISKEELDKSAEKARQTFQTRLV